MPLRLYNTLSKIKEPFEPLEGNRVRIYTCGLTVQDYCHIGHARMAIIWACFKNWLRESGYDILHIENFTDLNEKISARALEHALNPLDLAQTYIDAYKEDMAALGLPGPDRYVRVSEEIPEIIGLIDRLIAKGFAYASEGNVYFKVSSYPAYGRLSGRRSEEGLSSGRIAIAEDKESSEDFALWTVPQPGEPVWESPWGGGTPGWHIECSAMSMKYLGAGYDCHGGGLDLIFPHHENELAQSAADGNPYTAFWVHHGMVNGPDGTKMSKSLGNFFRVRDILALYPGWAVCFFLLSTHYRSPITFSPQLMAESQRAFSRLQRLLENLAKVEKEQGDDESMVMLMQETEQRLHSAMDDDFNTAQAIAILFDLSRQLNTALQEERLCRHTAAKAVEFYHRWGRILLFEPGLAEPPQEAEEEFDLSAGELQEITDLIAARQEARQARDWPKADAIRQTLEERGFRLTDTPQGAKVSRL